MQKASQRESNKASKQIVIEHATKPASKLQESTQ